jgi:cell division septation protein DedD
MRALLLLSAVLLFGVVQAQTQFSMYRLSGNLPQANMLNPALAPNSKVTIGLPVISSIYLNVDNDGISFRDLFRTTETDSLALDTVSIFKRLKASQSLKLNESLQLFYLGVRGKKGYLALSVHQVSDFRVTYPGDLLGWAIRGPGSSTYLGKPLDFNNFYGKSTVYGKISLAYARDILPKLRIGVRYNYLVGIAAAETTDVNGTLSVGIDSVNIKTGKMRVQTGGIEFFNQDDLEIADYQNYFLKGKNKGMSVDIGGTYDLTPRLTLSASLTDLGYINWKEYTKSYDVAPINYTFKGFDALDYLNKDSGDEFLEAEIDSISNLFQGSESSGNTFKTSLIGKFYAGINYKILKVNNFSALLYFDMFNKKINPALSVGYNLQLGRILNATVGATFQNKRINNFGAGIALKLGYMQFFATSDRANSFVYPARASRADAHFGMNLAFGKVKKKDKPAPKEEKKERPKEEPVYEEIVEEVAPADTVVQQINPEPIISVDTLQADTLASEVIQQDSVVAEPILEQPILQDTVKADTVHEAKVVEPVAPAPTSKELTVKLGTHSDELQVAHYVVAGAFKSRENAARYSEMLKKEGYDNSFGFVTDKQVYHIYVFKSDDLEETRQKRDQFRALGTFQFASSWILTVVK